MYLSVDLILLTYCIYLLKLLTEIGVEFFAFCGRSASLYTLIGFIYIVGKISQNIRKCSEKNEVFDGSNHELLVGTTAEILAVKVERKSCVFCTAVSQPSRIGQCVTVSTGLDLLAEKIAEIFQIFDKNVKVVLIAKTRKITCFWHF